MRPACAPASRHSEMTLLTGAYFGSWQAVGHERAAISSRIARLTWMFELAPHQDDGTN